MEREGTVNFKILLHGPVFPFPGLNGNLSRSHWLNQPLSGQARLCNQPLMGQALGQGDMENRRHSKVGYRCGASVGVDGHGPREGLKTMMGFFVRKYIDGFRCPYCIELLT